jgi:acyl-CoA reductase-like NAD-dependent aldehyde dehydrogenase
VTDTVYRMWIGGEWCASESGGYINSINPANAECIARIPRGTKADAHKAAQAARTAFDQGEWPKMSYQDRGDILRQIAQIMESR